MSIDFKKSFFNEQREHAVADGQSITEEGQFLVFVPDGSGGIAVQPSAGAPGERPAGFSLTDAKKLLTDSVVEELVVPVGGGTVSLQANNLVTGSTRAHDFTNAADLTLGAGAPAAAGYQMDLSAGTVTFNAAEAGNTISMQYRYMPTMQEVQAKYHERSINARGQDLYSQVNVGKHSGRVFTSMYDSSQAYAAGDPVYSGAGGLLTSAAGGAEIGFISQEPGTDSAMLGIEFSL